MKSKFLYQDVDVVSLADKSIVDALSAGTMTKFSWRRESSVTTSGSLKMDSCLVLTECLSRRILRLSTSPIDLIHSERVSSSTSSFFAHRLAYASHASMIMSKFWCHSNFLTEKDFYSLGIYKEIKKIWLLKDVRIGRTKHGCLMTKYDIPYNGPKGRQTTIVFKKNKFEFSYFVLDTL